MINKVINITKTPLRLRGSAWVWLLNPLATCSDCDSVAHMLMLKISQHSLQSSMLLKQSTRHWVRWCSVQKKNIVCRLDGFYLFGDVHIMSCENIFCYPCNSERICVLKSVTGSLPGLAWLDGSACACACSL